jgi:hypothetical protein
VTVTKKKMRWTPSLVKQFRGKRSLAEFGVRLGAPKNTVWHWEAGQSHPDATYADRLSELAERERFLEDWKLAGSMTLHGDLESARAEISRIFRESAEQTSI